MIKLENIIKSLYPILKRVLLVFTVIIIISFLYWWFTGLHTIDRLETIFFVTGGISLILGVFMRNSSREGTYGTMLTQPYTGSKTTMEDRLKQSSDDLERSWSDLVILSTAGILAILLSGLIHIIN
jgi:hypothetical protein